MQTEEVSVWVGDQTTKFSVSFSPSSSSNTSKKAWNISMPLGQLIMPQLRHSRERVSRRTESTNAVEAFLRVLISQISAICHQKCTKGSYLFTWDGMLFSGTMHYTRCFSFGFLVIKYQKFLTHCGMLSLILFLCSQLTNDFLESLRYNYLSCTCSPRVNRYRLFSYPAKPPGLCSKHLPYSNRQKARAG